MSASAKAAFVVSRTSVRRSPTHSATHGPAPPVRFVGLRNGSGPAAPVSVGRSCARTSVVRPGLRRTPARSNDRNPVTGVYNSLFKTLLRSPCERRVSVPDPARPTCDRGWGRKPTGRGDGSGQKCETGLRCGVTRGRRIREAEVRDRKGEEATVAGGRRGCWGNRVMRRRGRVDGRTSSGPREPMRSKSLFSKSVLGVSCATSLCQLRGTQRDVEGPKLVLRDHPDLAENPCKSS